MPLISRGACVLPPDLSNIPPSFQHTSSIIHPQVLSALDVMLRSLDEKDPSGGALAVDTLASLGDGVEVRG
jgi:hypothetical protein